MAQLRDASEEFAKSNTLVLIVGPDSPEAFEQIWKAENIPFTGLPDPAYSVLKAYGKQVGLFKLGSMPTQVLVDKQGLVRFAHFGHHPSDMPSNAEILGLIKSLDE
jgi:peroxiredoxin Q/BCP